MRINAFPALSLSLLLGRNRNVTGFDLLKRKSVVPCYFGRGAIWNAVCIMELTETDNVLMPAYHCSIEVEAVLKAGTQVRFYNVNRNMRVDLHDLKEKIDDNTKAVFVIHYFGFPQPIDEIKKICEENDLLLIEDAAHSLFSSYKGRFLGTHGDFGVLSMKKSLPIPNGGALMINNSNYQVPKSLKKPNFVSVLREMVFLFVNVIGLRCSNLYGILDFVFLKPIRKLLKIVKRMSKSELGIVTPTSMEFSPEIGNWGMSKVSQKIIENIDVEYIKRKRRANYKFLLERIVGMDGITPCFKNLPEDVCPFFLPIVVNKRENLQKRLSEKGVLRMLWESSFTIDYPIEIFTMRATYPNMF